MVISHCYWHLVVKNCNFTLLLTILWSRMAIGSSTPRSASRSTLQMHHGIYIMGCIWQPFCILQEKVGISCYFWIIRIVNSQLAWYSHVRCSPLNTAQTPPTWQWQISTMRADICQVQYVIWVLKLILADLPADLLPPPKMYHGIYIMDVFGSHFGFFKKRWEFPVISE